MPDFNEIRRRCDGMMRADVYEAIYNLAITASNPNFVELGTAHGAATVCLAHAISDVFDGEGVIHTIDRFEKNGKPKYMGSDNLEAATAAISHFGFASLVNILAGDVTEMSAKVPNMSIGLLMLDMDGRIDRDLKTFFDRLEDGAPIIIDDCADRVRVKANTKGYRIDQKHRLTYLLTKSATEHGLLVHTDTVYQTWFGKKGKVKFSDWPQEAILDCYRELVFANGEAA